MNGLEPTLGMKKQGRLILSGYVVPSFTTQMEYISDFPDISQWDPPSPFDLMVASNLANERLPEYKRGWYFRKGPGDRNNNSFTYGSLNRVRMFVRNLITYLNDNVAIYRKSHRGSPRMRERWTVGSINRYTLQLDGDVHVEIPQVYQYPEEFIQGVQGFLQQYTGENEEIYPMNENNEKRSKQRQTRRAALIKPELQEIYTTGWKNHPNRVNKGVAALMRNKGLSRYDAFHQVVSNENTNLYNANVAAQGVGTSKRSQNENTYSVEENNRANNILYNGGKAKRKTRRRRVKRTG